MTRTTAPTRRAALLGLVSLPVLPLLAACDGGTASGASDGGSSGATASALSVTDPWAKAAESDMTGVFGVLKNTTDKDVHVTGAKSPAAGMCELHETITDSTGASSMQKAENGFVVLAGGEFALEPGANHIMLMQLTGPLKPGDEVEVTLELEDGTTIPFTAAVKEFTGAKENYGGASDGGGMEDMGGMGSDGGH